MMRSRVFSVTLAVLFVALADYATAAPVKLACKVRVHSTGQERVRVYDVDAVARTVNGRRERERYVIHADFYQEAEITEAEIRIRRYQLTEYIGTIAISRVDGMYQESYQDGRVLESGSCAPLKTQFREAIFTLRCDRASTLLRNNAGHFELAPRIAGTGIHQLNELTNVDVVRGYAAV